MKLSLSLLAAGAAASRVSQDDSCYSEWIWEECSWSYYQVDYCSDDCGWWYTDAESIDDWGNDWWITCDEFAEWWWCQEDGTDGTDEDECYGEWYWEDCSGLYWQSDYCTDDCGWWYSPDLDDDWSDDWWVSCDEFDSWEECNVDWVEECDNEWLFDECWQAWWRDACDFENEANEYGWIYWSEDDELEYWVTGEEWWNSTCVEIEPEETCDNEWLWDECWEQWYRYACDFENEANEIGWIYWEEADDVEYWVTSDEWWSTECV